MSMMQNKKGQVIIINIVMLVMALLIFMALIPVVKEQVDMARNFDSLNCKSTNVDFICKTEISPQNEPCYLANYSKSETVACAMLDRYIPYIVILVLLAGAAKLMANRVDSMFAPSQY